MGRGMLGLITSLLAGAGTVCAQLQPPAAPGGPEAPAALKDASPPALTLPAHPGSPVAPPDRPAVPASVAAGAPCPEPCFCFDPRCGWIEAEYLLWFIKNGPLPLPLVTTGPSDSAGILGAEGTRAVFGGGGFHFDLLMGGRFAGGLWLNPEQTIGAEVGGFFLEQGSDGFARGTSEDDAPLLARPIINAQASQETAVLIASPGQFDGGFTIDATSRFWGVEANALGTLLRSDGCGLGVVLGLRYLNLREGIWVYSQTAPLPAGDEPGGVAFFEGQPVLSPNRLAIQDTFSTVNEFYGGQIGVRARFSRERLLVNVTGKVAFGGVHQVVQANGLTLLLTPEGEAGRAQGGVLATLTNIGRRGGMDGAIIPEASVRVGYQLTNRLTASVGYTILYWDNVVRPGDQIIRSVNLTQVPSSFSFGPLTGPRQPVPQFQDGSFWAQGLSFGLAFRF